MLEAPTVTEVNATSVTLQWDAWNSDTGDTGDGPVIGYNVYAKYKSSAELHATVFINASMSQSVFTLTIGLNPGAKYGIFVKALREGPGGEGAPSPIVEVTTPSLTTEQPTTTPRSITTNMSTTVSPVTTELSTASPEQPTTTVQSEASQTMTNIQEGLLANYP